MEHFDTCHATAFPGSNCSCPALAHRRGQIEALARVSENFRTQARAEKSQWISEEEHRTRVQYFTHSASLVEREMHSIAGATIPIVMHDKTPLEANAADD